MTPKRDIRRLMQPHLVEAVAYGAIDPPEILARQAGIPEDRIIKLDGNENLYGPSPKVFEALGKRHNYHIYPDPQQRRIREALAGYAGAHPENVVAGVGSDELIDLLLRLFVSPGETVLQCEPTFAMYATFTHLVGGKMVSVPLDGTFDVDVPMVRQTTDGGTKVIFVASPNNPTGNSVDEETVRQLLEMDILVVVDEAYFEFSGKTIAHLVPEYSNLAVLRTFSKWAGLAGMRVGYGIMDPAVAERLLVIKPPYNISVASEVALLASLDDTQLLHSRVRNLVQERNLLYNALQQYSEVTPFPSDANFILCQLAEGKGYGVYKELAKRGIFVRYYNTPLLRDYIRVSVGLPGHNQALLEALHDILK